MTKAALNIPLRRCYEMREMPIINVPAERGATVTYFAADQHTASKMYTACGGFLDTPVLAAQEVLAELDKLLNEEA